MEISNRYIINEDAKEESIQTLPVEGPSLKKTLVFVSTT